MSMAKYSEHTHGLKSSSIWHRHLYLTRWWVFSISSIVYLCLCLRIKLQTG